MTGISTLYNVGGTDKFTPTDRLHTVLLADFAAAAGVYLYDGNGQFKTENIQLPKAEIVPYWQGSGKKFDFADTSKIDTTTGSGNKVTASGILGVMFDHEALGVANLAKDVDAYYNGKARFWNNFYHYTAGYWVDLNENGVVFFVA